MAHSGLEQLALFAFTVLVTLATDLMWGIILGVAFAFVLNLVFLWRANQEAQSQTLSLKELISGMFRNPVAMKDWKDKEYHLYLAQPMVCFNYMHLSRELAQLPPEAEKICLNITDKVLMIDHTTMDNLMHWMMQHQGENGSSVELVGLDRLRKLAASEHATRVADSHYQESVPVLVN